MRLLPKDLESGWTPFAWLVYLLIFLAQPVFQGAGAQEWTVTVAGVAIFFVLYFRGFWNRGRRVLPYIAGLALLGTVFIPMNSGASVFFVYAAGFAGTAGRPAFGVKVLAGLLAYIGVVSVLLDLSPAGWIPALVFSTLIGGVNIHFAEVGRRNSRLRLAQEEVRQTATAAERERIGRDLHDLLGHSLSVITLKAELAGRLVGVDPARAQGEIEQIEQISRGAMAEVRKVVQGYRAQQLGVELAKARMALAAADVDLVVESSPFDLEPAQESVVALALREAVTNVIRHARARRCTVRLRQDRGEFRLVVQDDGSGAMEPPGSGLKGMEERVETFGGRVERDGSGGTTLTVVLPLKPPSHGMAGGTLGA